MFVDGGVEEAGISGCSRGRGGSSHGTSTWFRCVLQRRRFPFTLNGVTSSFAKLHCGSVASLCLRCSLQKLRKVQLFKRRRKRQPIKSYASTSASQSNCVLVWPGREINVIGFWSRTRHAHRQASTRLNRADDTSQCCRSVHHLHHHEPAGKEKGLG